MFAGKAGAYPSGAPLLALPTNIRLGRKGLPVKNILAYYNHSLILDAKSSFITLARGLRNLDGQSLIVEKVENERCLVLNFSCNEHY